MTSFPRPVGLALALLALVLASGAGPLVAPADGAAASVSGHISGPSNVGVGLKASYQVYATGGPAFAANGTQVGILSFSASLVGVNTSSATITPSQGVLINGTTALQLVAPNLTESLSLYVDVTSNYTGTNQTVNLTYVINVIQPILLTASLVVVGPGAVKAFDLTVQLDGAVVGTVPVPSLTSGQTYPVNFSYVNSGLSPGWHTFSISLAEEHGLVAFTGGAETYTDSFYVTGAPNQNAYWYLAGALALGAVVFIWITRVAARRRPKAKKSAS